jgi:hypothetical protein
MTEAAAFRSLPTSPGADERFGESVMQDAKRLRARAELCLKIAQQMSDCIAATEMHARAADYLARAVEMEHQSSDPKGRLND